MTENKATFVKELYKLVSQHTSEWSGITDMTYLQHSNGEEYVYITYKTDNPGVGPQRRFCVTASSCSGILDDFLRNCNKAPWMSGTDKIDPASPCLTCQYKNVCGDFSRSQPCTGYAEESQED